MSAQRVGPRPFPGLCPSAGPEGDMVDGLLECGKKNLGDRLQEAKMSKHQDCNAVRNSVVTAAGIIHCKNRMRLHEAPFARARSSRRLKARACLQA